MALRARLTVFCPAITMPDYLHATDDEHELDSRPNDEVPQGVVTQHEWLESGGFPKTKRRYSVYVPAQHDGTQAAALMVFKMTMHLKA